VQSKAEEHEEFSKKTVEEYLMNRASFSKFPLRHYRQLEFSFDVRRVGELLRRLQIPTEITVLVFGGYTGQFAKILRDLGMKVIFTDPMEEWVTEAKKSGFEAYRHSAEGLPSDLLDRCQLAATFECYFPLGSERVYSILRLLTRERGLLFAERKSPRWQPDSELGIICRSPKHEPPESCGLQRETPRTRMHLQSDNPTRLQISQG
jgi:hypothetical protein